MKKNMSYGDRLRHARKRAGLTQEQLAAASGVKQGTISKIERGDQAESAYDTLLAYHLNVSAYWLTTGEGDIDDCLYSLQERALIKAYRAGSPGAKQALDYLASQAIPKE